MANFSLTESPALQRAAIPRNSSGLSSRDWDDFASALLEDGLTLTALELYTELLESGKDLQCLKDYFSNPGNFEHTLPQTASTLGYLQGMGMYVHVFVCIAMMILQVENGSGTLGQTKSSRKLICAAKIDECCAKEHMEEFTWPWPHESCTLAPRPCFFA